MKIKVKSGHPKISPLIWSPKQQNSGGFTLPLFYMWAQIVSVTICRPCSVFSCYLGSYLSSKGKSRFCIYEFETLKNGVWVAKKPDKLGLFAGYIFFVPFWWWRRGESNPCPKTELQDFLRAQDAFWISLAPAPANGLWGLVASFYRPRRKA